MGSHRVNDGSCELVYVRKCYHTSCSRSPHRTHRLDTRHLAKCLVSSFSKHYPPVEQIQFIVHTPNGWLEDGVMSRYFYISFSTSTGTSITINHKRHSIEIMVWWSAGLVWRFVWHVCCVPWSIELRSFNVKSSPWARENACVVSGVVCGAPRASRDRMAVEVIFQEHYRYHTTTLCRPSTMYASGVQTS
eukprot:COSAG02_NODE_1482_length_12387_cov_6.381348_9_plen_190_part_00